MQKLDEHEHDLKHFKNEKCSKVYHLQ